MAKKTNNSKKKEQTPQEKAGTKSVEPIGVLSVVKDVAAIKIQTISPKLVDALDYLDGMPDKGTGLGKTAFSKVEIVGKLPHYGTLVVIEDGKLYKLRGFSYAEWRTKNGATQEQANAELAAMPQLFTL